MTRRCSKCKQYLELTEFGVVRARKDGLSVWCKRCNRESVARNRATPEGAAKHRAREIARYKAAPDPIKARAKKWYSENKERANKSNSDGGKKRRICPVHRLWETIRQREWYRQNPGMGAAKSSRRMLVQRKASPAWLSAIQRAQIQEMYDLAVIIETQTGIKQHVDHIVPLRGKTVCGLHVPWNLQVIPASENCSKGNKLIEAA